MRGVDARTPAPGSEDGPALRPPAAEASERKSRQGPRGRGCLHQAHRLTPGPPRARPPQPPPAGEGWGQGGVSARQLLKRGAQSSSCRKEPPRGRGCSHRKLKAVMRLQQLEAPTEPAPGPRMTGRAGAPSCLPPPSPASPGPAGRGWGGQAGGGEVAWSPQPRQGGLRLEAGLRSSWKAQGHRGKPGPRAHSPGGPAGQGRALRPHRAGAGLTRAGEPWRTARPRGSREPLGQNKQTQRAGLRGAEGTGQHTQGSRARGRLRSAQAVRPALASGDPGLGLLGSQGRMDWRASGA